jgi:RNA polymerase sigma factor (sigma-70 family)
MDSVEDVLLNNRGKLLGFIQARVGDADLAEDVLQDGLLRAIRAADSLKNEEKLIPWFYRILNNAIIDTYRRKEVENRYLEEFAHQEELQLSDQDETAACECLRSLLSSLKPEYGDLIETLELSGGSLEQVAQRLNISRNTLKVRRHRARQALRQQLEDTCRTCAVHGCLDCTCQPG